MNYRHLGRTGVKVAPLALGTANFGTVDNNAAAGNPAARVATTNAADSEKILLAALDGGINLIDTANSYNSGSSERIIGDVLKRGGRRHEAIIATKAHFPVGPNPNDRGNSRRHLIQACEDSLQRLATDYIDLYQLHRPDPDTPIDETLAALTDLVRAGKVRYIGCSTFPGWQIMEALMVSELKGYARFISEQPPYNLLDRRVENERIPLAQKHGLAILPWAPLGMGVLAGRYDDAEKYPADSRAARVGGIYAERVTARGIEIGRAFSQLARNADLTPAQLAVLWVKDQPGVTAPLIGVRTMAQLEEFLPVLEMDLSDDLRTACDELVRPGSAAVDFHNTAPWMKMAVSA